MSQLVQFPDGSSRPMFRCRVGSFAGTRVEYSSEWQGHYGFQRLTDVLRVHGVREQAWLADEQEKTA